MHWDKLKLLPNRQEHSRLVNLVISGQVNIVSHVNQLKMDIVLVLRLMGAILLFAINFTLILGNFLLNKKVRSKTSPNCV